MDEREKQEGYDVGYGKPPAATRFKKGQSGNPKGRPRGKRNASSLILRTLGAKVVINENGRRREITKFEAALTQLANKAAQGDMRALNLATALMRLAEERVEQDAVKTTHLQDADFAVLQGLMKRLEETKEEISNEGRTVRQDD
jgi:Family of unknown function (DUF5681)